MNISEDQLYEEWWSRPLNSILYFYSIFSPLFYISHLLLLLKGSGYINLPKSNNCAVVLILVS